MIRGVERERPRDDRSADAGVPAGTEHELALDLGPVEAARHELVETELLDEDDLETLELLEPRRLERARVDAPRPVLLDVDERIADQDRHLVPELGGADRVGVDQDVRHAAFDATRAPPA